ncbi:unnamed protein product, partial [Ectocarpus sp. 12 AP-2014]
RCPLTTGRRCWSGPCVSYTTTPSGVSTTPTRGCAWRRARRAAGSSRGPHSTPDLPTLAMAAAAGLQEREEEPDQKLPPRPRPPPPAVAP